MGLCAQHTIYSIFKHHVDLACVLFDSGRNNQPCKGYEKNLRLILGKHEIERGRFPVHNALGQDLDKFNFAMLMKMNIRTIGKQ